MAKSKGGAIYSNQVKLTIKASSFDNNSAGAQGGAVHTVSSHSSGSISESSFNLNKAAICGGAVFHVGKELLIETSIFHNNTVTGNTGQGGAVFTKGDFYNHYRQVVIFHCIFDGNQASFRGGAIMAANNFLLISNSSFQSSLSYPQSERYFGGELLFSKSMVMLEHVSFLDIDSLSLQNSLILHQGVSTITWDVRQGQMGNLYIYFKTGVLIKCLTGKKILVHNNTSHNQNTFKFISVSCSFCPQNLYSLSTGHVDLFSQHHPLKKTDAKCYHCPWGGVCEKGKIRAANNFWGFIFKKEVRFASCPYGYCCFDKECINYFSCHAGRTGILCGQCQKDFTENLVTADCLPIENCRHPWYLLMVVIIGILYVSVLMYLNEITKILKALLIPKFMSKYFKYYAETPIKISETWKYMLQSIRHRFSNEFNRGCEQHYLTDDIYIQDTDETQCWEQMQGSVELLNDEEMQSTVSLGQDDSEESVLPGLMKIIIFFYQTNVLFKIFTGSKSRGFINVFQETVTALFNLRTDGTFAQNLSWCPLNNLQPVSKVLLKSTFIIYQFFLIFLAYILCKAGRLINITTTKLYNTRLLCCILRLVYISYAGITVTCFSLLSCVQLGHHGKVLFIDGSIQCYRWWQMIVIRMVCCWIVPFPVTIYISSQLLHKRMLSAKHFFLSLLFPLPAICCWLYNYCKNCRKDHQDIENLSQDVQDILQITEGPFRKLNNSAVDKSHRLSWESVLIGRRLVMIFMKTFIINTVVRLSLMLLCTSLFLVHHIHTKPFSSNLVNNIETVSLFLLNIICFLNLFPAYNYIYPTNSIDETQDFIQVLKTIESALNLVFPSLLGLVVAILLSIRIFQFIFWSCQCCFRFICFCTKYKLS